MNRVKKILKGTIAALVLLYLILIVIAYLPSAAVPVEKLVGADSRALAQARLALKAQRDGVNALIDAVPAAETAGERRSVAPRPSHAQSPRRALEVRCLTVITPPLLPARRRSPRPDSTGHPAENIERTSLGVRS